MAGIEMKGFENLKREVAGFAKAVQENALVACEDAAAKSVVAIIRGAAPRDTGDLAKSIRVVESKDKKALVGGGRRRLLIGPTRKKGFEDYGYLVDHGWKHPKGPRVIMKTRRGRTIVTGRRARGASGGTHSQRGVQGFNQVAGTSWFTNLAPRMESAARAAGIAVFNDRMKQIIG
jgi:hypothetical protein